MIRPSSLVILKEGDKFLSEEATIVSVADEGGGLFFRVNQYSSEFSEVGEIRIDPEELPALAQAFEMLSDQWREEIGENLEEST